MISTTHIELRNRVWRVQSRQTLDGGREHYDLLDPETGETLKALCPPDTYVPVVDAPPAFDRAALSPWQTWFDRHETLRLAAWPMNEYAALHAGRISPEPYQFAPAARMLRLPRPNLLIADDVGLGKTIEAGICMLELIARGRGRRILLIVPPALIPQWQSEMLEKFQLPFDALENAAAVEQAQTGLAEGIRPWVFKDRVVTSIEYIKKREVTRAALEHPWDLIVVDEAHCLADSGTPANPYATARARLGRMLRDRCRALLLLTATPHNGYRHSFRSLPEIVEPADAASEGLNLQRFCRRIYHLELPWNPNRMEQRNGRVDRHGQTRPPIIKCLFYPDSPEDRILERLTRKLATMRDDRVSTPDLLGIGAEAHIEDALTELDAEQPDEGIARRLFDRLDNGKEAFVREMGVLLSVAGIGPVARACRARAEPDPGRSRLQEGRLCEQATM